MKDAFNWSSFDFPDTIWWNFLLLWSSKIMTPKLKYENKQIKKILKAKNGEKRLKTFESGHLSNMNFLQKRTLSSTDN